MALYQYEISADNSQWSKTRYGKGLFIKKLSLLISSLFDRKIACGEHDDRLGLTQRKCNWRAIYFYEWRAYYHGTPTYYARCMFHRINYGYYAELTREDWIVSKIMNA
jgi:hypothetical protein